MARRLAFVVGLVGVIATLTAIAGCGPSSNHGAPDGSAMTPVGPSDTGVDADVSCALGGACSQMQLCMGGIADCPSNCQCLGGSWQAPCPADVPTTGSACTAAGAYCGYSDQPNPCGADNCYCQGGAWSCGPSCAIPIEDAATDVGVAQDAGACTAAGGQCVFGGCSNPGPQSCGTAGMFCCLNSVPDASLDAGPADASSE